MNNEKRNLIVGALVLWTGSTDTDAYGVIAQIGHHIKVRWDTADYPYLR